MILPTNSAETIFLSIDDDGTHGPRLIALSIDDAEQMLSRMFVAQLECAIAQARSRRISERSLRASNPDSSSRFSSPCPETVRAIDLRNPSHDDK